MSYTVKKTITGKHEVRYPCPGCQEELRSPIEDAGAEDRCPHCDTAFRVPGLKARQMLEEKEAKAQAKVDAEQREQEARQRIEDEQRRVQEEQRQKEEAAEAERRRTQMEHQRSVETGHRRRAWVDQLRRRMAQPDRASVPGYYCLYSMGIAFAIIGLLCVLGGSVVFLVALAAAADQANGGLAALGLLSAAAPLLLGLVLLASAEGLHALRDIARNSWHSRYATEASWAEAAASTEHLGEVRGNGQHEANHPTPAPASVARAT